MNYLSRRPQGDEDPESRWKHLYLDEEVRVLVGVAEKTL